MRSEEQIEREKFVKLGERRKGWVDNDWQRGFETGYVLALNAMMDHTIKLLKKTRSNQDSAYTPFSKEQFSKFKNGKVIK